MTTLPTFGITPLTIRNLARRHAVRLDPIEAVRLFDLVDWNLVREMGNAPSNPLAQRAAACDELELQLIDLGCLPFPSPAP